jgi:nucleoside-diphosphate-sugar epimerase
MPPSMQEWSAPLAARKVAVTGASGFIGRRLVRALCAAGADVTALLRSRHEARTMERMGARVALAGLVPGRALDAALTGQEIVFNLAYDVRAGGAENLAAFDALLAAAARGGAGRIVHASSAVVYDDWPAGRLDEEAPMGAPGGGGYRQAKIAMENRLMEAGFEVAILQPTIVYGPGSALWTDAPMAALRQGPVVLPDPVGQCPAVFVDDVVQAALRAGAAPDLGRERFLIAGADQPGWDTFFRGYAGVLGQGEVVLKPLAELEARLGPPRAPSPETASETGPPLAARVSAQLRRMLGRRRFEAVMTRARALRPARGPVYPNHALLALYAARPAIEIRRAEARLGYVPEFSFQNGLAAIQEQLRETG